ncbi:unnamed protein product [Calicophoron daubneyi]|uniref:Uncharacterized protein n=1 Tax=Calicophoron daubneyi TaxID=300641 RepID=A0AAV2TCW3_CALDB
MNYYRTFFLLTITLAMCFAIVSVLSKDRLKKEGADMPNGERLSLGGGFSAFLCFFTSFALDLATLIGYHQHEKLFTRVKVVLVFAGFVCYLISLSGCFMESGTKFYMWLLTGTVVSVEACLFSIMHFVGQEGIYEAEE